MAPPNMGRLAPGLTSAKCGIYSPHEQRLVSWGSRVPNVAKALHSDRFFLLMVPSFRCDLPHEAIDFHRIIV